MKDVLVLIVNKNPPLELSGCERGRGDVKNLSELPCPLAILQNTLMLEIKRNK